MKQLIIMVMIFLGVVGVADASYLTYEKLSGYIPVCGESFDCGSVLSSPYAQIGPIPLSAFGIGYYLTVITILAGMMLEAPLFKKSWLLVTLTSLGFAFSVLLVGLMAFVIEAWCLYCLISAATSTLLFLCSLLLKYTNKNNFSFKS